MVYRNYKSRSFRVRRGLPQASVLGHVLFFLFINHLSSAALFTLTIWSFGPDPSRSSLRWRPHKELCFDWRAGLSTGAFLSIRENVRSISFQWIPTKLISSPTFFTWLPPPYQFNFIFSWSHLRPHSFFFKHVSLLKAKFFPRLKALRCISASS